MQSLSISSKKSSNKLKAKINNNSNFDSSIDTSSKENSSLIEDTHIVDSYKKILSNQNNKAFDHKFQESKLESAGEVHWKRKSQVKHWSNLYSKFVGKNSQLNKVSLDEIKFRIKFTLEEGRDESTKNDKITQEEAEKQKRIRIEKKKQIPTLIKNIIDYYLIDKPKKKEVINDQAKISYKDFLSRKKSKFNAIKSFHISNNSKNGISSRYLTKVNYASKDQNNIIKTPTESDYKRRISEAPKTYSTKNNSNKQIRFIFTPNKEEFNINFNHNSANKNRNTYSIIASPNIDIVNEDIEIKQLPKRESESIKKSNSQYLLINKQKRSSIESAYKMSNQSEKPENDIRKISMLFQKLSSNKDKNEQLKNYDTININIDENKKKSCLSFQSKKESKVKIKKETASLVLCEKQKIQEKIENLKKKYSVSIDEKENQMNKNTSFNTQQYQNTLIGATIQSISSNYNSIENTANKKLSINLNSIIINQENNENYTITEESLKPNANRNIINTVSSKEDSVLSRSNRKQSLKDYNKPLKRIYNRAQTHDNLININNLPNKIIPEHRKILSENKNISNTFRSMKSLNLFASVNKFNPFEEKTNGKKINKFALIKGILKLTPDQLEKYIQGESKNNNYILEDHSKYLSKELKKNLQDIKFQQFISASCIGARIHNNNTRSIFIDYNQFLNNNDYKKAVVRNSSQNVIETEASQVGKSPLKKPINVTTFSPLKIEKNKKVEKFASLFSSKISYLMSKYNLSQEDFDYNMNSLESLKNDVKAYEKELSLAEMKGFYKKIRNKKLKHLINFEQFKGDVCSLNIAINNLKSKGIDYWNIFSNNINKRNDKIDQLIFKVRSVNI